MTRKSAPTLNRLQPPVFRFHRGLPSAAETHVRSPKYSFKSSQSWATLFGYVCLHHCGVWRIRSRGLPPKILQYQVGDVAEHQGTAPLDLGHLPVPVHHHIT